MRTSASILDEKLCAAILDTAHDAVIVIDERHTIVLYNRGTTRIFGYEGSEVIGRSLEVILPPGPGAAHRAHVRRFAQSACDSRSIEERREISGRRKDGTVFPAEASIAKLIQDGENPFTVILRDITEHKQAESALREEEGRYRHTLDHLLTRKRSALPPGAVSARGPSNLAESGSATVFAGGPCSSRASRICMTQPARRISREPPCSPKKAPSSTTGRRSSQKAAWSACSRSFTGHVRRPNAWRGPSG